MGICAFVNGFMLLTVAGWGRRYSHSKKYLVNSVFFVFIAITKKILFAPIDSLNMTLMELSWNSPPSQNVTNMSKGSLPVTECWVLWVALVHNFCLYWSDSILFHILIPQRLRWKRSELLKKHVPICGKQTRKQIILHGSQNRADTGNYWSQIRTIGVLTDMNSSYWETLRISTGQTGKRSDCRLVKKYQFDLLSLLSKSTNTNKNR